MKEERSQLFQENILGDARLGVEIGLVGKFKVSFGFCVQSWETKFYPMEEASSLISCTENRPRQNIYPTPKITRTLETPVWRNWSGSLEDNRKVPNFGLAPSKVRIPPPASYTTLLDRFSGAGVCFLRETMLLTISFDSQQHRMIQAGVEELVLTLETTALLRD
ncbi:hypothetical protein Tco_1125222 [Tanacetum coccineum]|uniref:Uncharacterized protein n=1 Tax=Tanacetum coccineum TaxID=301880 RepID=A0ABQ5JB96_9ASTR